MFRESPVRKLAKAIQTSVNAVQEHARYDAKLARAHDALCDVLNALNQELSKERQGSLPKTWRKIGRVNRSLH